MPRSLKRHNGTTLDEAVAEEFGEEYKKNKHFKENTFEEKKEPQQAITWKKNQNPEKNPQENKANENNNEELIKRLDNLSVQNQELNSIVQSQNVLINSLAKLVNDNQTETQSKISVLHGDVAQLTNTLNGFVRSEVNKKKVQQSSKIFPK